MRDMREMRALICYAGSAPEASIGSKPIGSELELYIGQNPLKSQEFRAWNSPRRRIVGARAHFYLSEKQHSFRIAPRDGAPRP